MQRGSCRVGLSLRLSRFELLICVSLKVPLSNENVLDGGRTVVMAASTRSPKSLRHVQLRKYVSVMLLSGLDDAECGFNSDESSPQGFGQFTVTK